MVYYSSSLSIDKTYVESPMVLELSTSIKESSDVGHTIASGGTMLEVYSPAVYNVTKISNGSNTVKFTVTTSYIGIIHFAILSAGTPHSLVNREDIYNHTLTSAISYGYSSASLASSGVNTEGSLIVTGLKAQTSFMLAVYLN